ncbi:MAG: ion transporter, partial [Pseudomonadota bacterium]|nr:ion transporter [Pseudomonadota bacterium]
LLVGLIVNSMQDAHSQEKQQDTNSYRDDVTDRLRRIEEALKRLEHR